MEMMQGGGEKDQARALKIRLHDKWDGEHEESFDKIKDSLAQYVHLAHISEKHELCHCTDASIGPFLVRN